MDSHTATLQREAPETLKAPMRNSFINQQSYQKANDRYRRYGHWDTPDPKDPKQVKEYNNSIKSVAKPNRQNLSGKPTVSPARGIKRSGSTNRYSRLA